MGAGCEGHRARGTGGVGFGSRYQGGESEDREGGLPAADTFILRRTPMAAPIIDAGSAHQTLTDTVRAPVIGDRQSEGPHHWCSICTPHPHPKPSHTPTHTPTIPPDPPPPSPTPYPKLGVSKLGDEGMWGVFYRGRPQLAPPGPRTPSRPYSPTLLEPKPQP